MTAPPKNEPTRPGVGSAKTDEDFPIHDPTSSILPPAKDYLAIKPRTGTAAFEQLQVDWVKNELKHKCEAQWQGGSLVKGRWQHPGRVFYAIHKDRLSEFKNLMKTHNISLEEIELVPTHATSAHHMKAIKQFVKSDVLRGKIEALELKKVTEVDATDKLFGADEIDAKEHEERRNEIYNRYQKKIEPLEEKADKLESLATRRFLEEDSDAIVIEPGEMHVAAEKARKILSNPECKVFQRRGQTVRILNYIKEPRRKQGKIKRETGVCLIVEADEIFLLKTLSERAKWAKFDKREKDNRLIDCPPRVAQFVLSDRGKGLPVLKGIICAPTLRDDGSILDLPGYDEESGLFFDPCGVKFPSIPQNPTKEQAFEALAALKELLKEFSFDGEVSRAVAVAELMTGVIRGALEYAPAFGNNAYDAGSGKTLLADITAILATGHRCSSFSPANSEEENRKRFSSVLLNGDLVVCIDNVQEPFESPSMCSILTGEQMRERILGTNTTADIPTTSLFIFTGNNLTFRGDMNTRVVVCTIDSTTERPGERVFERNLADYTTQYRGELVAAVLTILRAFIVAGCPDQNLPAFRLFTDWTKWVRAPLVWLGMKDPYESTRGLVDNDPIRDELAALFPAVHEAMEHLQVEFITVRKLIQEAVGANENNPLMNLRDVLLDFAPDRRGGIDPTVLGNKISRNKGRIVGGYRLVAVGKDRTKAMQWRVIKVGNAESAESCGDKTGIM